MGKQNKIQDMSDASKIIAIVGMGGVLPGSESLEGFWQMVLEGRNAMRSAPEGRWALDEDEVYAEGKQLDHVYSKNACFLEGFEFDGVGFDLPAEDLLGLDPLYHVVLEAGRRAWEDAKTEGVDRSRVGMVFGNIALPTDTANAITDEVLLETFERAQFGKTVIGDTLGKTDKRNRYVAGLPGGILANALGLGGGVYTLDAACSSSLYALKFACDQLLGGKRDVMLSGGVSRPDSLYTQMGFAQLGALSKRGLCSPFDEKADGLVVGEGGGFVVLKRLDDAIKEGDEIHAIFRGFGLSNDLGGTLMSPDSEGQVRAMTQAYAGSGILPNDIDLVECHGTGTPVGDGVEFKSLQTMWASSDASQNGCVIGSVKSNVGHLLTGAGAAGLLKVLCAMREAVLPATANFVKAGKGLNLETSCFKVLSESQDWAKRDEDTPRRAAISGFGFGGINGHVLLEQWDVKTSVHESLVSQVNDGGLSAEVDEAEQERLAIVGIACEVGELSDIRSFSERSVFGVGELPSREMKHWWGHERGREFRGNQVDALSVGIKRFRIPPNELKQMQPQQLLMLRVAGDAMGDAGLAIGGEGDAQLGVFVGIGLDLNTTNFHFRWMMQHYARVWNEKMGLGLDDNELADWVQRLRDASGPGLNADRTMGALGGIVASRLARAFKAGGPSFTISSEERSGLDSMAVACEQLRLGVIDRAIVGAVDFASDLRLHIDVDVDVDDAHDGVFSDGACAFVLKRASDAAKEGDLVYGYVKSFTSVSDCGGDVLGGVCKVMDEMGADVDGLGYLEGIGIGGGLAGMVAKPLRGKIGDLGSAMGLMGVMRGAISLSERVLPELNNGFGGSYWLQNQKEGLRQMGVLCVSEDSGVSGLILEESESVRRASIKGLKTKSSESSLFVFEGKSETVLLENITRFKVFVKTSGAVGLDVLSDQWFAVNKMSSDELKCCCICVGSGERLQSALVDLYDAVLSGTEVMNDSVMYTPTPLAAEGKLAFVFPGAGSHFSGMGKDLSAGFADVLETEHHKVEGLKEQFIDGRFWNKSETLVHKDIIFGQVTFGVMVSDILKSIGLNPQAYVGYSLGETTSMFASGSWLGRDEMFSKMQASDLFGDILSGRCDAARKAWGLNENEAVDWQVAVVHSGRREVESALAGLNRAYLLIVNSEIECVVGGQGQDVKQLIERLGVTHHWVSGVTTVHCEVATEIEDAYRELHLMETNAPEGVGFYSGILGEKYEVNQESIAQSIVGQAMGCFDFSKVVENAYADGVRLFVEVGPGGSCSRMISQTLGGRKHFARSACVARRDEISQIKILAGQLLAHGVELKVDSLFKEVEVAQEQGLAVTIPVGVEKFEKIKIPKGSLVVAEARPRDVMTFDNSALLDSEIESSPEALQVAVEMPPVDEAMQSIETVFEDNITLPEIPLTEGEFGLLGQEDMATQNNLPLGDLVEGLQKSQAAQAGAQQAFLSAAEGLNASLTQAHLMQAEILAQMGGAQADPVKMFEPIAEQVEQPVRDDVIFDREMCMEFAIGKIGNMLGEKFSGVDAYPTRVRLPDEPLMLVDRITALEGEPLSMTSGRVVTEHDVKPGAWYLDHGRIPTCVAVEAGQADLFLSAYLGIDYISKGLAVYRLLDAEVTFHDALPAVGDTIVYDIKILEFFRQGDTYLFRFEFEGFVNGKSLITMKKGCAGFFTQEELDAGKGVIRTTLDTKPMPGKRPADWQNPCPIDDKLSFNDGQINALRAGDLGACFGSAFENLNLTNPVKLPSGLMTLVHRILEIDPTGGRFGLGHVIGEADIHPDDWFLTCHFVDDKVMPGTLMYECCLHTLRVYLLRMGWVCNDDEMVYEPVVGIPGQLKCRGQVLQSTQKVVYEVVIKEIGYAEGDGTPYVIADSLMYADGKAIVQMTNMSLRMTGINKARIDEIWAGQSQPLLASTTAISGAIVNGPSDGQILSLDDPAAILPRQPIYNYESILAYSSGKPSEAFGPEYGVFDEERKIARLPRPPFQFLDRVVQIQDCTAFDLKTGAVIQSQYDVPQDAWYFDACGHGGEALMPYSVLLEAALQPCGWMAAYLGSALTSETDIKFRNLGGSATQFMPVGRNIGTLTVEIKMTNVSLAGGMVIQNYDMAMYSKGGLVFKGDTYFGFFSQAALANQVGFKGAVMYEPTAFEMEKAENFVYPTHRPFPCDTMQMVEQVDCFIPDGGEFGLGFIQGSTSVDPSRWFFQAHFYQDPVWPGSLGLESFVQLLKVVAARRWGGENNPNVSFQTLSLDEVHTWVYRGQVIPQDERVKVYATITAVDDERKLLRAKGFLTVDGRVIYQMDEFAITMSGI